MKTLAILLLTATATPALACDTFTPNCTPVNVSIDNAQKGPVTADPLLTDTNRERAVRSSLNG